MTEWGAADRRAPCVWSKSLSSEAPATAGPSVADAQPEPTSPDGSAAANPPEKPRSRRNFWLALIGAVIALDIVAFFVVPPYPAGNPGQPVTGIADLITANFEFPAPAVVWDLAADSPPPADAIVFFHPSISATVLTTWFVMAFIIVFAFLATRGLRPVPGRVQNAVEAIYEALQNFAISLGGDAARRYVPLFAGVFLFVLFANWTGLLPIAGKIEFIRAPTSDVNVTIGMALVSFFVF